MKCFRRFLFVILALIAGCAQTVDNPIQPAIPSTAPSATQPVITDTSTPRPTAVTISTSIAQSTPTFTIEKNCLSLEDNIPSHLHLAGVWIRQDTSPYLENLEENTKYRVPLTGGGTFQHYDSYFSISPNGKWLAYLDVQLENFEGRLRTKGYSLRVIHSSGHSLKMNYWPISFQKIYGWVDNQDLLIGFNQRDFVLNPFTGKWNELKKPSWLINMDINTYSIDYSPHLDQVIIRMKNHSELRDTSNGSLILSDSTRSYLENSWSPDGNMLGITTNNGQILHVFQKGSEILMVNLAKEGLASSSLGEVYIRHIEWSPNNKKLLLEKFGNSIIIDTDKQEIYTICFNDKNLEHNIFPGSFFYSLDGKYLVTHLSQKETNYHYQFFDVLIDLDNKSAYKLPTPENRDRIGWLALP